MILVPDGTQPLRTVMARLGRELEALHALSETAQDAVATLTGRIVPDPELSGRIQTLDSLTQHLSALATFVDDLASALPVCEQVDLTAAASRIRLGRLRSSLVGEIAPHDDTPGAVELF